MRKLLLVLLFTAGIVGDSVAEPKLSGGFSGEDLKSICDKPDPANTASCISYVVGVLDGIRGMNGDSKRPSVICNVPVSITFLEWMNVIREYLNKHPDQLHYPATIIIPTIVNAAFPCAR